MNWTSKSELQNKRQLKIIFLITYLDENVFEIEDRRLDVSFAANQLFNIEHQSYYELKQSCT